MKVLNGFNLLVAKFFGQPVQTINFILDHKSGFLWLLLDTVPSAITTPLLSFVTLLCSKQQIDIIVGAVRDGDVADSWQSFLWVTFAIFVANLVNQILHGVIDRFMIAKKNAVKLYYAQRYLEFVGSLKADLGQTTADRVQDSQWSYDRLPTDLLEFFNYLVEIPMTVLGFILVFNYINPYMMLVILISGIVSFGFDYLISSQESKFRVNALDLAVRSNSLRFLLISEFTSLTLNGKFNMLTNGYIQSLTLSNSLRSAFQVDKNALIWMRQFTEKAFYLVNVLVAGYSAIFGYSNVGDYTTYPMFTNKATRLFEVIGKIMEIYAELKLELTKLSYILLYSPKVESTLKNGLLSIQSIEEIELRSVEYQYPDHTESNLAFLRSIQGSNWSNSKHALLRFIAGCMETRTSVYQLEDAKDLLNELSEASEAKPIIKGITVSLKKGNVYSLIGNNGAGKSTLLTLLKAGMEVTSGTILINSQCINLYDPDTYRLLIQSVSQTQRPLPLTLRENLNCNQNPQITDHDILSVLHALGLTNLTLQDLDKVVGDALCLSGGQAQLALIASAMLNAQDGGVVIFDEATNQLSPENTTRVLNYIRTHLFNSIVLIISHEMRLCQCADQILTLEDGVITNQGSYSELLEHGDNLFARYYLEQQGTLVSPQIKKADLVCA